ncbi:MAG: ribose 5-phosphate isomerase B [Dehalogenimonas sp.]|uniref:Ribose 5-phosphate isomerase B n=1 Tax=Candidatus Dehalogenimonas loeffleri TaxID=3127115 RepID=A0ABZ2J6B5_9CHLR|nr:ribose 5-phosphate isomerase B [Dehalogenimonas sp.]
MNNGHQLAVASDHGGFALKQALMPLLQREGYKIQDLGAHEFLQDDDYPDYAEKLAREVNSGRVKKGILICGSGAGACMAANKIPGIRASVCHDSYSAHQAVEHDDMNVLCLGARVIGLSLAQELAVAFLKATFRDEPRYRRRLDKMIEIERRALLDH